MKKTSEILAAIIMALSLVSANISSVSAHDLERWHNYYPASSADSTNSFGIGSWAHINGRIAYYSWANNNTKNLFETCLLQGESSWNNMIDIIENSTSPYFQILYNPNISSGIAAYVEVHGQSYEHHPLTGILPKMVIGNITNYNSSNKKILCAHELGHLWGISDLYNLEITNLNSIYSDCYGPDAPTRHDKNAMFICQDRPWYKDSNNNTKFLKSPGQFATNQWVYSVGYNPTDSAPDHNYVNSNGVVVPNAGSERNRTYGAYSIGNTMYRGSTLNKNRYLVSNNKKYVAVMQADGNFAVYNSDSQLWSANTNISGSGDRKLKVQPDGNIVIYDSNGNALWNMWSQSGTNHRIAYYLVMQDDGNLVAYDDYNSPIWNIGMHSGGVQTFYTAIETDINSCCNQINGATKIGTTLHNGQILSGNQYLSSNNKRFIAKLNSNGRLSIYNSDGMIWSSNTSGANAKLKVQSDGNIVLYNSTGTALWHIWNYAGVDKRVAIRIVMQEDGNLVAYDSNGKAVWWSQTAGMFGAGIFNIT